MSAAAALNEVFSTECSLLDIGERQGWTSYIDFIRPEELGDEHTMKGQDERGRRFIVFKCTVNDKKPIRLFTTLFQRHPSDHFLYHTAGHTPIYHDRRRQSGAGRAYAPASSNGPHGPERRRDERLP